MKLNITATIENATISEKELGHALFQFIIKNYFDEDFDDAGCDWLTNEEATKVFIADQGWCVSHNKQVAEMVNTANFLIYGETLTLKEVEDEDLQA